MRVTTAITNHAPIGKYHLKFFLKEDISCLCEYYSIETRCHILHNCGRFNKYWYLMRDIISQVVVFLDFNPDTFSFHKDITQQSSIILFYF